MANDTIITVVGNLTADPNLRFTNTGTAVVDFTVASTPRTFDRQSGQWKDGETLFLRCSAWREYAENIAESLGKGMRVIVQGRLVQRSYTPREGGEQRTVVELQVDEVGPALRYAKAQVTRTPRQDGGNYGGGGPQGAPRQQAPAQQGGPAQTDYSQGGYGAPAGGQEGDPWGAAPAGSSFDDAPPF